HNVGVIEASKPDPKTIPLTGLIHPSECKRRNLTVYKIGWKTGLTKGKVIGDQLSGGRSKTFGVESLDRNPFSDSGDSGSVVYTEDGAVLGQVYMGGKGSRISSCTNMTYIFGKLMVDFGIEGELDLAGAGGF